MQSNKAGKKKKMDWKTSETGKKNKKKTVHKNRQKANVKKNDRRGCKIDF
jgi:hypothetical protein